MHLNHVRSKYGTAIGSIHVEVIEAERLPATFRSLATADLVGFLDRFDRTLTALGELMWWNPALKLALAGGVFWLLAGWGVPLLHGSSTLESLGLSSAGLVVTLVGITWHHHSVRGLRATAAAVERRRALVLSVLMERPDWHG